MTVTIHWLVTSPRLPAGLLTAAAWDLVRGSRSVLAGTDGDLVAVLRTAGVDVVVVDPAAAVDRLLRDGGVWVAGPGGDERLAAALAARLAADPSAAELELVTGSWDPPGARLLDMVAVIDRLRSPGGCPWDAEQTHRSLAPFLLEEAYETVDAIHGGSPGTLREELGDLLMQPLFHARVAAEDDDGFDIDDVAADAVEKLVRRHPHVFGDETAGDTTELHGRWDALKRAEKPERRYATDGVVTDQPALSLAAKYLGRTARADVAVPIDDTVDVTGVNDDDPDAARRFGDALLALTARAARAGVDAELALREAALRYAQRARDREDSRRDG